MCDFIIPKLHNGYPIDWAALIIVIGDNQFTYP